MYYLKAILIQTI